MSTYKLLYGVESDDRKVISDRVAKLLGVKMESVDSDVWDFYYFYKERGLEGFEVRIYSNFNEYQLDSDDEGFPYLQPDHSDLETLISFLNIEDADTLDRAMQADPVLNPRLIKRAEEYNPADWVH